MAGQQRFRFGPFTLDVPERLLTGAAGPIPLPPKAFDTLVVLVRNRGRLLTKQELLDAVWPDVAVEEGILTVHVSGLRRALGDSHRSPRYIETVARSGYRFVAEAAVAPAHRWSLAVLPPRPAYGGDVIGPSTGLGVTDALIDRLARHHDLVVRPTRSVLNLTGLEEDPVEAGRELRVDAVVVPTVEATPAGLRLAASLVRVHDGALLWRSDARESAPDVAFPVMVAQSVAACLGCAPAPVAGVRLEPPRRVEVYEQVGLGRRFLSTASMVEMPKAVAAFQAAVGLDAGYAPAHAGLALAWCAQAELRVAPVREAYEQAKTAALRALAVDDTCADAQVALATVLCLSEWDWAGAERSAGRALELNPNHPEAYLILGSLLDAHGRLEDGFDTKLQALERDPLSPRVHMQLAHSCWNQRRYDDAIAWANRTLAIDPRHLLAREFLAGAYLAKGDGARYIEAVMAHARVHGVPEAALEPIGRAFASGGRTGIVRQALQHAAARPGAMPDFQLALLHGEAGELDDAFRHLDGAIEVHDPALVHLAVAPQWDPLRADPRFATCLMRLGLTTG